MKVTAKTEYALRAMVDLARFPGKSTTLDTIAERQQIPPTILPNIIQTLARSGLVQTSRGHAGGVRLARTPEEINVNMVLEVIEGALQLDRCHSMKNSCPVSLGEDCPLRTLWVKTQTQMQAVWKATTLAQLAQMNGNSSATGRSHQSKKSGRESLKPD